MRMSTGTATRTTCRVNEPNKRSPSRSLVISQTLTRSIPKRVSPPVVVCSFARSAQQSTRGGHMYTVVLFCSIAELVRREVVLCV